MITGLGFSEILIIVAVVLMFFGSKELPRFIREIAGFLTKARRYSDKLRREIDDLSRPEPPTPTESPAMKKRKLRARYLETRKGLSEGDRREKSEQIWNNLRELEEFRTAGTVMVYVDIGSEVHTKRFFRGLREEGKRVVVPYCKIPTQEIGLAEIVDPETQLVPGAFGVPEPERSLRDNFFKSDLQLIICPGVAFDRQGGRLGRGKHYYDSFLGELRGRVPIVGLAFAGQIMDEQLPFEYHDVPMDEVVTEDGLIRKQSAEQ